MNKLIFTFIIYQECKVKFIFNENWPFFKASSNLLFLSANGTEFTTTANPKRSTTVTLMMKTGDFPLLSENSDLISRGSGTNPALTFHPEHVKDFRPLSLSTLRLPTSDSKRVLSIEIVDEASVRRCSPFTNGSTLSAPCNFLPVLYYSAQRADKLHAGLARKPKTFVIPR